MAKAIKAAPGTTTIESSQPRPSGAAPGAVEGEMYVSTVASGNRAVQLPALTPRKPFVLAWHEQSWMVMYGRLVPALRQMRLQPGVSGVSQPRKNGPINFAGAKARAEGRGWNTIAQTLGPGGSYVRKYQVDPVGQGKTVMDSYHTAWERLYSGSTRVDCDEAGYTAWLLSLIESGQIPQCPPHVARLMLEQAEARAMRVGAGGKPNPAVTKAAETEIKVLKAYLKQIDESAVPVDGDMVGEEVAGV